MESKTDDTVWTDGMIGNAHLYPIGHYEYQENVLYDTCFATPDWISDGWRYTGVSDTDMAKSKITDLVPFSCNTTISGNVTGSALSSTGIIIKNVDIEDLSDLNRITFSNCFFDQAKPQDLIMSKRGSHEKKKEPIPLSIADDSTFEKWLVLPETDGRTIAEFAEHSTDFSCLNAPKVALSARIKSVITSDRVIDGVLVSFCGFLLYGLIFHILK